MNPPIALNAALVYVRRGWPVFPVGETKKPLTAHGLTDATTDEEQIRTWWANLPRALAAIATGERSGIVAVDVDLRPDVNGFDTLDALGVLAHPRTPTAHTPRGGVHLLFQWPGHFVKTIAGKLGDAIDIRADGGSLILPPGPGRRWDPILNLDTPLADMPDWACVKDPPRVPSLHQSFSVLRLTPYGEAALDSAVKRIVTAVAGQQEMTLNREAFGIGRLAAGGVIPPGLALDSLLWAARRMPSLDRCRPWKPVEVERKVQAAFSDGLRQARAVERARA